MCEWVISIKKKNNVQNKNKGEKVCNKIAFGDFAIQYKYVPNKAGIPNLLELMLTLKYVVSIWRNRKNSVEKLLAVSKCCG